tara:strand:- start:1901 stop:2104 length:204 start_codon:yes stop_codon:yes gene_type:complete
MDIESVKSEIERLTNDKSQTDATIVNLEKELTRLKQSSDMLSGALQTCNYFLQKFNNEVSEEKEEDV